MNLVIPRETIYHDTIYTSRELNRSTGAVLDEALKEPITITRKKDSFALLSRQRMGEMSQKILYLKVANCLIEAICKVNMGVVLEKNNPYKWVEMFDQSEHLELLNEVTDAINHAENTDDWEELRCVIFEWEESAIALSSQDLDEFKEGLKN